MARTCTPIPRLAWPGTVGLSGARVAVVGLSRDEFGVVSLSGWRGWRGWAWLARPSFPEPGLAWPGFPCAVATELCEFWVSVGRRERALLGPRWHGQVRPGSRGPGLA
ncbi:hypothetical protein V1477_017862 [Vespula maculifrons]|uniref:Uncharacterized protein n=1 Tax=Vespula maculifrons TaxID=7453 RepID=A0ABD2AZK2_VESMC